MALQKGIRIHQYLDDWLVRASTHDSTNQVFNFVGYQFDLKEGKVRPTPECWQTLTDKIRSILSDPVCPVRQFMSLIGLLTATEKQVHLGRLHMRPIQWHLKNNWRVPESVEKVIPGPNSLHLDLRWWLEESNVLLGQPLHPLKHAVQIFTDASKEGWGTHLDEHTARGTWSLPESKLHINQLELKAGNPQGTSHPRPAERDRRQAIQTWPDHSNRVVTSSRSVPSYMIPVAPAPSGPVCHQVLQQTATVCVTGPRPPGMGSGCTQPLLGGPQPIRLSTSSHLGQSDGEFTGLPFQQNNSDCPRVAQHALVLGSSGNVRSNPTVSTQHTKLSVSAIQPGSSQEPVKSESTCLAPRASAGLL